MENIPLVSAVPIEHVLEGEKVRAVDEAVRGLVAAGRFSESFFNPNASKLDVYCKLENQILEGPQRSTVEKIKQSILSSVDVSAMADWFVDSVKKNNLEEATKLCDNAAVSKKINGFELDVCSDIINKFLLVENPDGMMVNTVLKVVGLLANKSKNDKGFEKFCITFDKFIDRCILRGNLPDFYTKFDHAFFEKLVGFAVKRTPFPFGLGLFIFWCRDSSIHADMVENQLKKPGCQPEAVNFFHSPINEGYARYGSDEIIKLKVENYLKTGGEEGYTKAIEMAYCLMRNSPEREELSLWTLQEINKVKKIDASLGFNVGETRNVLLLTAAMGKRKKVFDFLMGSGVNLLNFPRRILLKKKLDDYYLRELLNSGLIQFFDSKDIVSVSDPNQCDIYKEAFTLGNGVTPLVGTLISKGLTMDQLTVLSGCSEDEMVARILNTTFLSGRPSEYYLAAASSPETLQRLVDDKIVVPTADIFLKGDDKTVLSFPTISKLLTMIDGEQTALVLQKLDGVLIERVKKWLKAGNKPSDIKNLMKDLSIPEGTIEKILTMEPFPSGWSLYMAANRDGWKPIEGSPLYARWDMMKQVVNEDAAILFVAGDESLLKGVKAAPIETQIKYINLAMRYCSEAVVFEQISQASYVCFERLIPLEGLTMPPYILAYKLGFERVLGAIEVRYNTTASMGRAASFNTIKSYLKNMFDQFPPSREMVEFLNRVDFKDANKQSILALALSGKVSFKYPEELLFEDYFNTLFPNAFFQFLKACPKEMVVNNLDKILEILSKNGCSSTFYDELIIYVGDKDVWLKSGSTGEPRFIQCLVAGATAMNFEEFKGPVIEFQKTIWAEMSVKGHSKALELFCKNFGKPLNIPFSGSLFPFLAFSSSDDRYKCLSLLMDYLGSDAERFFSDKDEKGNNIFHRDIINNGGKIFTNRELLSFVNRSRNILFSVNDEGNTIFHLFALGSRDTLRIFQGLSGLTVPRIVANGLRQTVLHLLLANENLGQVFSTYQNSDVRFIQSFFDSALFTKGDDFKKAPVRYGLAKNPEWCLKLINKNRFPIQNFFFKCKDKDDNTLLHAAGESGNIRAINFLRGKYRSKEEFESDCLLPNRDKITPLHFFLRAGIPFAKERFRSLVGKMGSEISLEAGEPFGRTFVLTKQLCVNACNRADADSLEKFFRVWLYMQGKEEWSRSVVDGLLDLFVGVSPEHYKKEVHLLPTAPPDKAPDLQLFVTLLKEKFEQRGDLIYCNGKLCPPKNYTEDNVNKVLTKGELINRFEGILKSIEKGGASKCFCSG